MNLPYFTLAEARAALPRVRALMDQAQAARQAILRIEPDLWPILSRSAGNGHSVDAGRVLQHYRGLQEAVKAILKMGVLVKDLDSGLVDFLSLRDGREVFLCWRMGEADIRYWHELDAGFAGRQPVDE